MLILSQMVLMLDILEMFLNFHYLTYVRIDENANSEQRQVRKEGAAVLRGGGCFTSLAPAGPQLVHPVTGLARLLGRGGLCHEERAGALQMRLG